jgi:hypothetical protein
MTAELKSTEEMLNEPKDLLGEIMAKVWLEEAKDADEAIDIVDQVLLAAAIVAEGFGAKADDFEAQSRGAWKMVESFAKDDEHVIH